MKAKAQTKVKARRSSVAFRVTVAPFQSERDGRWYVIVKRGPVFDHVQLMDGPDAAIKVLAHQYGCTPAVAKRRLEEA